MFIAEEYFNNLGFKDSPFASTNAQDEEYLEKYFINPPYFSSLVGSIKRPKSSIVVAPRGFGKTAQRKIIENMAGYKYRDLICIVYDNFPIEGVSDTKSIRLSHHLERLIRYLLIALLSKIAIDEKGNCFNSYERSNLLVLIKKYLSDINPVEVAKAISSIKGIQGKLFDIWMVAGRSITSIINIILKANGLGKVDLSFENRKEKINDELLIENLDFIESLFNKIGIKSVFVLIDRVDETALTGNDSKSSYLLIKPLIKDLRLLERKTIVFKFFLWDKITEHWQEDIRRDRVDIFELNWTDEQLRLMMNRRLRAYSEGKINSLNQVLDSDTDFINNIVLFANKSPRDLINILRQIFDYHMNNNADINSIPSKNEIIKGIDQFCISKFTEIIINPNQQKNLKKIKISTFTIPYLVNDVFKLKDSTVRNIIMPWTRAGIVTTSFKKVKLPKSKNPINVYSLNDIRIARIVCLNQKFEVFLKRNIVKCEQCGGINIFDKKNEFGLTEWYCNQCQNILNNELKTL